MFLLFISPTVPTTSTPHPPQMDGHLDPQTPESSHQAQTSRQTQRVAVGDIVNVFQGTDVYVRGHNTVAFIGTVVGYDATERKWLVRLVLHFLACHACSCLVTLLLLSYTKVRDIMTSKHGFPNMVEEQFMSRLYFSAPNPKL